MVKNRKRKMTVDTEFAADLLSEELKAGQLRTNPAKLDDDALFIEDTQPDDAQIALPVRRKRLRASKEKRLTRSQAIVAAANPLPFASGGAYAKRKKRAAKPVALPSGQLEKRESGSPAERDLWTQAQAAQGWVDAKIVASRPKSVDVKNRPRIAAVEVDPAGCSYNPDYEQHQDAVAVAVASENMKLIDRELQPKAPPLSVTQADFNMKEMALQLEDGSEDEAETALTLGEGTHGEASTSVQPVTKARTKKDRARQLQHKQAEAEIEAKRSLKRLRRQLDNVKGLQHEIDADAAQLTGQLARRKADLEAKEAIEPPKLGKHKFAPLPLQVLATDDITGSLRQLRTTPVVVKDRFNSFQKRGLIQVTVKSHWNKPTTRRVKQYEKGATMERDQQMQESINKRQRKRLAAS